MWAVHHQASLRPPLAQCAWGGLAREFCKPLPPCPGQTPRSVQSVLRWRAALGVGSGAL